MKKSNLQTLFKEAEEDLKHAKEELYRPMEDVVNFSACVFTRQALYKYLLGLSLVHAEENDDPLQNNITLEKLIKYNGKYNKALRDIDFSMMSCKCHEMTEEGEEDLVYCTNVKKVNSCSDLSESVRKILIEKRPSLLGE